MLGDCHIHLALDGYDYKAALGRHRETVDDTPIHAALDRYRELGITFLRDGGDKFGVSRRAKALAPQYGIDYRSPIFPIHRRGRYGSFIGRGYDDLHEYRQLVAEAKAQGADFIKLMLSGIMDFSHFGVISDEPLPPSEVHDLVAIAHDAGFPVMAHVNGADRMAAALDAGIDSLEHGGYANDEVLHQLAESKTVWVPTLVTIANLRGAGRFPEEDVQRLTRLHMNNIAAAHRYGAIIALGSDAGAWRVPHGSGTADELALLTEVLGPEATEILQIGEKFLQERFSFC
ncbi:amidohydrolase family protein [Candidatus Avoscillospira sp. LCP25S3_F1]|uniref:amidohydrolase family protein n=1 Tax=Candidatus Avoscillospira sp. LCP25S3_F1 TaxID=3438825 RepID=UPI003F8E4668